MTSKLPPSADPGKDETLPPQDPSDTLYPIKKGNRVPSLKGNVTLVGSTFNPEESGRRLNSPILEVRYTWTSNDFPSSRLRLALCVMGTKTST